MNSNSTQPYADLPSEKVAQLRQAIRTNLNAGWTMQQIDQGIQAKYGVSAKQVMEPNPSDFGRSVAQGLTLGHADELAGLYAKLTGKSYEQARDDIRKNDAAFQAFHPVLKMLTEGVAGGITGMAAAPLAGIQKGAMLANVARGTAAGAAIGGISGEGNSNANTVGGVARDAAIGGGLGGVLGAGGSAIASKLASGALPKGAAGSVATEAASQLPDDPTALVTALQRQEQLAPGTVVLADSHPGLQKFVRAVGANREVAMRAADDAQARTDALLAAKRSVGKSYNQLQNVDVPADPQLTDVLDQVGRRDLISKSGDVDLGDLHDLRSDLLKTARRTTDANLARTKRLAATTITDWMTQSGNAPWLKQVDSDFAFLTDRTNAAMKTQQIIANSHASYAANRAAGVESGSLGGSIPMPGKGAIGTTIAQIVKPDRAARAKAIASLLLNPQRDDQGLQNLALLRDALLQSQSSPATGLVKNFVVGSGIQGLDSAAAPQ